MNKKSNPVNIIIIVIIIVFVIVFFVVTLGQIETASLNVLPAEFKDNSAASKSRHKRLLELIQKKEGLKSKLDKRFRITFFAVRIVLVALWFSVLFTFYKLDLIKDLEDVLNYSQASLFLLFILNFITFGTITELKNFIDVIKTKSENWVYGKYINLNDKIALDKEKAALLVKEIKK